MVVNIITKRDYHTQFSKSVKRQCSKNPFHNHVYCLLYW